MATPHDVIPLLLRAAPRFRTAWNEHRADWGEEEAGIYIDTGAFAHYVVDEYAANRTEEFPAIFETVERLIRDGDDDARGAAILGVLESIANIASHRPFGTTPFLEWLGPQSRQAWDELDKLWSAAGGSLAGVLRHERLNETNPQARKRWWQFWRR